MLATNVSSLEELNNHIKDESRMAHEQRKYPRHDLSAREEAHQVHIRQASHPSTR